MSGRRLFAIFLIFALASVAWMVLAGSVELRTNGTGESLGSEVRGLWGPPQVQSAPTFTYHSDASRGPLAIAGSDIDAQFKLDQRRKGLLWYSTYVIDFSAAYRVTNPTTQSVTATMEFVFPDSSGIYDGFSVRVKGKDLPITYKDGTASVRFPLEAGKSASIATGYRTNGMDSWAYSPSPAGAGVIDDFHLVAVTDFDGFDYPEDGISPSYTREDGGNWELGWDYESVVTGRNFGIVMPKPLNPGPLVGRITLFAPVSLLFFFAALILLMATREVRLHPIHYGFLAAAFFAFDLLLAYLADQIDINLAFGIAALTSVALVVGYLRIVVGRNRALMEIAVFQFIFLVLFSYSFFFEGFTGLAITVGAVLTLAFFMFRTAHLDWEEVFPKRQSQQGQWVPVSQPAQWVAQQPVAAPVPPQVPPVTSAPNASVDDTPPTS